MAHQIVRIGRVAHHLHLGAGYFTGNYRSALPAIVLVGTTALLDLVDRNRIGDVPALGVATLITKQLERMHDRLTGNVVAHFLNADDRILSDFFRRNALVDDLVDEGTVGTIFQQTAHQVRQQILVGTNRRVNPTGYTTDPQNLVVQGLTHTVEALKLVVVDSLGLGHFQDGRYRMGVVGRELRVDAARHVQQLGGTGQIRNVTAGLAGKHREAVEAHDLGALDLGIPVGTFHQAHHELAIVLLGQPIQPVEHER